MHSGIGHLGSNAGSATFSLSPKAQAKTASELSKSMESMRGHLQAQLRCKEAENSRLCMQIKVPAGPTGGKGGAGTWQSQGGEPHSVRLCLDGLWGTCCQGTSASERLWDSGKSSGPQRPWVPFPGVTGFGAVTLSQSLNPLGPWVFQLPRGEGTVSGAACLCELGTL